jgi:hypothetical protein
MALSVVLAVLLCTEHAQAQKDITAETKTL